MNKEKSPLVIAIAAVSGGGKTTITKHLNQRFAHSTILSFDDYDFDGPHDFVDWIDHGGNLNEWNLTPLVKDIESKLTEPLEYIFLDFPFSYKHAQVSKFIDFSIFIDTPLDIALARRIRRDFADSSTLSIINDMEMYLTGGRRAYLHMLNTIKPNADMIVDGTLQVTEMTNVIYETLKSIHRNNALKRKNSSFM